MFDSLTDEIKQCMDASVRDVVYEFPESVLPGTTLGNLPEQYETSGLTWHDGLQKLYDLYSFNVIPRMGQLVAGDRDSYQYLVESIRRFPDQDSFLAMIRAAGFEQAKYRNLSLGIAALHSGWKI